MEASSIGIGAYPDMLLEELSEERRVREVQIVADLLYA